MAFWGDPIEQPDHAVRACRTAIAIQPKLKELAEALKWHGLPGISARIGLNSGVAVAGNMGSDMQFNYTVIGSDVNLASRLEGVNKEFGTEIIISDATYQGAKEAVEVRPLARIQVKGQTKGVLIYELLGEKGAVDPERLESARAFEKALHLLWERKWDEARAIFSGYADPASKLYVELCAEYAKKPPAQNWDGTYVMTHK
jgi:adenylate cyclase